MDFEEVTLNRKSIYQGAILDVVVDDVQLPNGLGLAKRELVLHEGAVAVLAVTAQKKLVIVKQYRKAIDSVSYEIPAGKLEKGEQGAELEAAKRELEEETGYQADLELIYEFYTAIGFCNEKIKLYLAQNLQKVDQPRPQDEDEVLEVGEYTYQECLKLIQKGHICDAKTIIAIQYFSQRFGGDS